MYIDEEGLGVGENGGAFKEILCYFTGNMATCLLRYLCINNRKWAWLADCNCNIARLGIWFITVKLYYSRFIDFFLFFMQLQQSKFTMLLVQFMYLHELYIYFMAFSNLKIEKSKYQNFGVDIYCQKYFPFLTYKKIN